VKDQRDAEVVTIVTAPEPPAAKRGESPAPVPSLPRSINSVGTLDDAASVDKVQRADVLEPRNASQPLDDLVALVADDPVTRPTSCLPSYVFNHCAGWGSIPGAMALQSPDE
jgi:hypothetical protein